MAEVININRGWLFHPSDAACAEAPGFDDSGWSKVNIPHTNKLLPHHGFDDREYQFIFWYRKRLRIPDSAGGRRAFLDFDAVMLACEVFVDGEKVAEHRGGYTPFSVEMASHLKPGDEITIAVRVDSTEQQDIPPFGFVVDYLTFGGIYRDVMLRLCSPSFIQDLFARSSNLLTHPELEVTLDVEKPAADQTVTVELKELSGETIASKTVGVTGSSVELSLRNLPGIHLWALDEPRLYAIEARLQSADGTILDRYRCRFGFREARFGKDGAFRLNGHVVKLIGLDRHQTYPYIGQAAPARLQRRDADILKHELALNIVRTSHYPQSPHFLDRCDEIGLLVFEEIPGWQHIGDEAWQAISKQDVRDMILRDRNHPSIILWGVRINESGDNHDFYLETNRIAHELDPSRQTGGVRCHKPSEFLEDVFTFNDFSDTVVDPDYVPYLITEFNGHMFPTKTWDCEERKVEHAIRHARIQSLQMLDRRISGAIGWCAFDYNTHALFGSGDRICYHGVSDIFRLPKFAAFVYASQANPSTRIVLEMASHWTMGDRSRGGVEPLLILSNCESIKIYIGGGFRGEYFPSVKEYPGLAHPPFVVRNLGGLWGKVWDDVLVEGYIGETKVAEIRRASDPLPDSLKLWADSNELVADGQDMTALNFQVVDKHGHVVPFTSEIVTIQAEGPVELIGTNPFAPQGGQGGIYVKARETTGEAVITGKTASLAPVEVRLKLMAIV